MKKIAAFILALVLMMSCVGAQAGWVDLATKISYLNNMPTSEKKLFDDWCAGLQAANDLYGNMLWALDYVDAWTENQTWDNLITARAACILLAAYINDYEFPSLTLTDEEMAELSRSGVATEVLIDYYRVSYNSSEMYMNFRSNIFCCLEADAVFAAELENVGELADWIRRSLESECEYLSLATNYLLMGMVGDATDGEALWSDFQSKYPIIFLQDTAWQTDAGQMEAVSADIALEIDALLEEKNALLLKHIADGENTIMDYNDGTPRATIEIEGCPDMLPVPLWHDPLDAKYASFSYGEDKTVVAHVCGEQLSADDCNIIYQHEDVSLAQVEEYMTMLEPYALAMAGEENQWTVLMEDYSVSVSWSENTVQMIFLGEGVTFSWN